MDNLDRFALLQFAASGTTKTHQFIHECAARPLISMNSARRHIFDDKARFFIPLDDIDDRIIMFSDNSGVYIDAIDFFPVHLSNDISKEISQWTEIPQL